MDQRKGDIDIQGEEGKEDEDKEEEDKEEGDKEEEDEENAAASLCDASFHAPESVATSGHNRLSTCTESQKHFLECVRDHQDRDHDFDIEESLNILSSDELAALWTSLKQYISTSVSEERDDVVGGVTIVALLTISLPVLENVVPPSGLVDVVVHLHSLLPSMEHKIGNNVCHLLEGWYSDKLPDSQTVINNCLVTLVKRSLSLQGTKSEVRRVWGIHQAVLGISLTENKEVIDLIVKTAGSSNYLTSPEGVRWLVFLMSVSPDIVVELHRESKRCLIDLGKSGCQGLGQVYLKSWEGSGGQFRKIIEQDCIQDLMYRGLVAGRGKSGISTNILRVLQVLHHNKRSQRTQTMLAQLYEPFLWRHLKVANSAVRLNATEHFFSCYPVENSDQNIEERSNLTEAQHTIMSCLLGDEDPDVRCAAVTGVCAALSRYWILIPAPVINNLVKTLFKETAIDSSSSKVRLATLKGVEHILSTCPGSHVYMKKVLPRLSDCLHDPNETVRAAMLNMLLTVRTVKSIKFWDICELDHLLARLETDKGFVCRRIAKLLCKSYFPSQAEENVLLERCIHIVKTNRAASRKFYQYIGDSVEVSQAVQLMLAILVSVRGFIKQQVEREVDQENQEYDSSGSKKKRRLFSTSLLDEDADGTLSDLTVTMSSDNTVSENKEEEEDDLEFDQHPYQDPLVLEGVLDIVCVLWMSRGSELALPENDQYRAVLEKKAGKWLTAGFKFFKGSHILTTVIYLASFLPDRLVTQVASYCLSKAKSGSDSWESCVDSLLVWKRGDCLFDNIIQGLQSGLGGGDRRRSRGVRFVETQTDGEQIATSVRLLEYMLLQPTNRALVLDKHKDQLEEVAELLEGVPTKIQDRLGFNESEKEYNDQLVDLLGIRSQLIFLLYDRPVVLSKCEELMAWSERELLEINEEHKSGEHLGRLALSKVIFSLTSCLSLGLADTDFTRGLLDWSLQLVEVGGENNLVPVLDVVKEAVVRAGGESGDREWEITVGERIPVCFAKLLSWLTNNREKLTGIDLDLLEEKVGKLLKAYSKLAKGKKGKENLEDLVEVLVTAGIADLRDGIRTLGLVDLPHSMAELGQVAGVLMQAVTEAKVSDYVVPALNDMLENEDDDKIEIVGALIELLSVMEVKGRHGFIDKVEIILEGIEPGELVDSVKRSLDDVRDRIGPSGVPAVVV